MNITDRIDDIVNVLENDGVILNPTDTIWGLGCHCQNEKAIKRIYEIKKRDFSQPLLILASSIEMIKEYVEDIHPRIETLLEFHNKPLTIIYPRSKNLPKVLCHSSGSIAIRLTQNLFCKSLIDAMGAPLVSTSANVSGKPFPKIFKEISSSILKKVDYVVSHDQDNVTEGKPSIVISYNEKGELNFLRE